MSKKNLISAASSVPTKSQRQKKELLRQVKKANRLAKKHNKLLAKQVEQAKLDHELAERHYLIEKSALQPTFRLHVTEFLTTIPDFVNDPEQASEAKFLAERGVSEDQRALRIKVEAKGGSEYMRPSMITKLRGTKDDERIHAMTELIYFIDVASLDLSEDGGSTLVYFVYRDRTTLPVLHKYQITPRTDSALLRWDATHLDTVYLGSRVDVQSTSGGLTTCASCAAFFDG